MVKPDKVEARADPFEAMQMSAWTRNFPPYIMLGRDNKIGLHLSAVAEDGSFAKYWRWAGAWGTRVRWAGEKLVGCKPSPRGYNADSVYDG
jgi:hypothetical protein